MSRYRVIVTEDAANDFREAFDYLAPRSPGAARELARLLAEALESLRDEAHQFAVWNSPHRRLPLKRFPYGLLYVLRDDEVVVTALAHSRRDPKTWTRRTP
jgi:toxin ParE1/3/4